MSSDSLVTQAQDRFISAWGQMGGAWGISRTMAEVFALLYITAQPLNTDEVMERLQISRGNASMSLRALQEWGIIARAHRAGDRKEYFESERDVWTIFKTIARERKKRELDPVLASLYEVRDMTGVEGERKASGIRHQASGRDQGPGIRDQGSAQVFPDPRSPIPDPKLTDPRLSLHNERLDALLEFMSTMEKLAQLATDPENTLIRDFLAGFGAKSEG